MLSGNFGKEDKGLKKNVQHFFLNCFFSRLRTPLNGFMTIFFGAFFLLVTKNGADILPIYCNQYIFIY